MFRKMNRRAHGRLATLHRMTLVLREVASRRPAGAKPGHLLDFVDQALFLGLRATGQSAVTQIVWVYDHGICLDGVRRFHRNMGYGMAGRLIEPSVVPFGRHRWITSVGPAAPLRGRRTEPKRPNAHPPDPEGSERCRTVVHQPKEESPGTKPARRRPAPRPPRPAPKPKGGSARPGRGAIGALWGRIRGLFRR